MSLEHSPARDSEQSRRLNTAEAARYIGLSASTLSKLRVFGGGPIYRKVNRRVIYDTRDLDSFLQSRSRTSTCDPGVIARLP
jgi:hypothetical protein